MPDGDFLRADEDVFDEEPQDALAFWDAGGAGAGPRLGEEFFQVIGEVEVGLLVGELGVQGFELAAEAGLAGTQVGIRARGSSMVISCSWNASIMRVIAVTALARASSSRLRCLVTGSAVRACSRRLLISARISAGSASRCVMCSQTTWSR